MFVHLMWFSTREANKQQNYEAIWTEEWLFFALPPIPKHFAWHCWLPSPSHRIISIHDIIIIFLIPRHSKEGEKKESENKRLNLIKFSNCSSNHVYSSLVIIILLLYVWTISFRHFKQENSNNNDKIYDVFMIIEN